MTKPVRRTAFGATLAVALIVGASLIPAAGTTSAAGPGSRPPQPLLGVLREIKSKPMYDHATWGISVQAAKSGEILFQRNGQTLLVTGSIMKVFSTATALHLFGKDYRFHTPVYRTRAVKEGVLQGNLVLVASGDLSLGLRERPNGSMVYTNGPQFDHTYANSSPGAVPVPGDPLAGLNSLAEQVRSSGIRRVAGNVVIDDRLFQTFFGWPDAEVSPISPIWVNDNRIDITTTPTAVGRPAQVRWRPDTEAFTVKGHPRTVAPGGETNLEVTQPSPRVFRISGKIAADAGPILRVGEIPDPSAFARTAFIEALRRAGVGVSANTVGPNPQGLLSPERSYEARRRVAEHVSGKLKEFVKVILKVSHNPGADLMACLSAVAMGSTDCEQGLVGETNYYRSLGVSPDSVFIFDGAGSDERDRATPHGMNVFLNAVSREPFGRAFRRALPILGVNGDLAESRRTLRPPDMSRRRPGRAPG